MQIILFLTNRKFYDENACLCITGCKHAFSFVFGIMHFTQLFHTNFKLYNLKFIATPKITYPVMGKYVCYNNLG